MAWNEPGKSGQDPWGNSGNSGNNGGDKKPPKKPNDDDLDQLLKKAQSILGGAGNKLGGNGGGIGGVGGTVIFAVILVVWLLSGIYIVDPAERGVVTRFGAFVEETKAGPHWHIPYPIETVRVVNVDQIRTAEIGYRSGNSQDNRNRSGDVPNESLMLTKDENIVDLKIAVQYQVISAHNYLFDVTDPDVTLRSVTESALREVVGQSTMDFVLTEGRNEVVARVQDIVGNADGALLNNTADATLEDPDDSSTVTINSATSAEVEVIEPNLVFNLDGPVNVDVGAAADFTARVVNTGRARAYQPQVEVEIPVDDNLGF